MTARLLRGILAAIFLIALVIIPSPVKAQLCNGGANQANVSIDRIISSCTSIIRDGKKNELADAYSARCALYIHKGQSDLAIADCTAAIQLARKNSHAFLNRCNAYSDKQDVDRAIADCNESIRLNPQSWTAFNSRCWVRAIAGRDLQSALSDCNEAIRLSADDVDPNVYDSRGLAYLKLGQFDAAIADYDRALKINPALASSWYGRGLSELGKGDVTNGTLSIAKAEGLKNDVSDDFRKYGFAQPATDFRSISGGLKTCHLAGTSPTIDVHAKNPVAMVRTGDQIEIDWSVLGVNPDCRTPLYLVFSTSARVRFEGRHLIATPPGATGPYGIKHASERTRIFVPLHVNPRVRSGSFIVKVYEHGPFSLEWALAEVPAFKTDPQTKADLAIGQERLLLGGDVTKEMRVVGGNPTIVIRDQYSPQNPTKVIQSNSGEFILQIYKSFYRVLDGRTSELILERSGWDPNFSPSSRFLGAFAAGAGFEVIDLYAGVVIVSESDLIRTKGFDSSVNVAAWANGDAILALSMSEWGGIEVQQTLVDQSGRHFSVMSCHACQGFGTYLLVDIDANVVAAYASETGEQFAWESLLDPDVGSVQAAAFAEKQLPSQLDEASEVSSKRDALAFQIENPQLEELLTPEFSSRDILRYWIKNHPGWNLGSELRLSHHCATSADDLRCNSDVEESQMAARLALKEVHQISTPDASNPSLTKAASAEDRTSSIRNEVGRGEPTSQRTSTVWDRLDTILGLTTRDKVMISPKPILPKDNSDGTAVANQIVKSIPSAKSRFPKIDVYNDPAFDKDKYQGEDNEASLLVPGLVDSAWRWDLQGRIYWLIRSEFDNGASTRYWLFLLRSNAGGGNKLIDLSSRLKRCVGASPLCPDNDHEIVRTENNATTYGLGAWPASVDSVTVRFGRYLLMSGTWLNEDVHWLMAFDLARDEILVFNRDVPEATSIAGYAITRDGRHIIQANMDGQLFFYRIVNGQLSGVQILRGYDIDEEIVVFDPRGYYASTPEGAQFVFLKFPGQPGYNSFQQFARALNRPDMIGSIFANSDIGSDPKLTPPPVVTSIAVKEGSSVTQRTVSLHVEATSALPLRKLRVFVDGRIAGEFPVTNERGFWDLTLPISAEGRWITAVAIDASDFESVPKGLSLSARSGTPQGRLFVISVGTNTYSDNKLHNLNSAVNDAQNFADTAALSKGRYYQSIDTTLFLDSNDLAHQLMAKIRDVVTNASEQDTIMLFVAGHGQKDKSNMLYLVTRETNSARLSENSLSWSEVASALKEAKARVIVFLDTCHSAAAGDDSANDDVVAKLIAGRSAMTIVAASNGQQSSNENSRGGEFTTALVRAINQDRAQTDANRNGTIELAELYAIVKKQVVTVTNGRQTPWLARNDMVGEVPLF